MLVFVFSLKTPTPYTMRCSNGSFQIMTPKLRLGLKASLAAERSRNVRFTSCVP